MHPAILALLICAGAAALEGAAAGRGVRERFAELRQPPFSPSLNGWFAIGAGYYLICFVLLYRLLGSDLITSARRVAVVLLLTLMVVNAAWGFWFFRRKNLRASSLVFLPYGLVALVLVLILARVDPTSALVLTPYLLYLGYAIWWSKRLLALNHTL